MPSKNKKPVKRKSAGVSHGSASIHTPVRVRMYRQGLGDCFLITIGRQAKAVNVLVDFGSLGATTTDITSADVVADIRKTTRNHLDLLIITHEHKDHLSGFQTTAFKEIQIDRVWLAWTENPQDLRAQELKKYKDDLGEALATAAAALTRPGMDLESVNLGLGISDLAEFAGDPNALGSFAKTVHAAMELVRTGFGADVRYLGPGGRVLEEDWLPGFRFYILGPPRSETKIRDLGDHGSSELYHFSSGLRAGAAAAAGMRLKDVGQEQEMPFQERFRIQNNDERQKRWLESYNSADANWRRIDGEWLRAAADLALQLDSLTNNTSLAFAIERVTDGKVLLFPADAQQGNWLSWHEHQWRIGRGRVVTTSDLLKRVVFYKTGHHGSHNATAREKGLELMEQEEELVAFIPVDRKVALDRHPRGSWKMPARPLYRRLLQKCQGRVVRSDIGWAAEITDVEETRTEEEFWGLASQAQWAQWREKQQQANVKFGPGNVFIDFTLA